MVLALFLAPLRFTATVPTWWYLFTGGMLAIALGFVSAHQENREEPKAEGKAASSKPDKLLRHVVLFKFKPEATAEQIDEVVKAFAALPKKIDLIVDFEHGTDVSVENRSQGFTHGFLVSFADAKARDTYLSHPAHQEFVQLVGPRLEKVLVFDYWAQR